MTQLLLKYVQLIEGRIIKKMFGRETRTALSWRKCTTESRGRGSRSFEAEFVRVGLGRGKAAEGTGRGSRSSSSMKSNAFLEKAHPSRIQMLCDMH